MAGRATAKVSIPSPNQLFHPNILNETIYPNIEDFANDIAKFIMRRYKHFMT